MSEDFYRVFSECNRLKYELSCIQESAKKCCDELGINIKSRWPEADLIYILKEEIKELRPYKEALEEACIIDFIEPDKDPRITITKLQGIAARDALNPNCSEEAAKLRDTYLEDSLYLRTLEEYSQKHYNKDVFSLIIGSKAQLYKKYGNENVEKVLDTALNIVEDDFVLEMYGIKLISTSDYYEIDGVRYPWLEEKRVNEKIINDSGAS